MILPRPRPDLLTLSGSETRILKGQIPGRMKANNGISCAAHAQDSMSHGSCQAGS